METKAIHNEYPLMYILKTLIKTLTLNARLFKKKKRKEKFGE